MQTGYGAGAAPQHDFKSQRFGLDVPHPVVELRRDVERSILASYGIPPRARVSPDARPGAPRSMAGGAFAVRGAGCGVGAAAGSLVQHAGMTLDQARAVVGL